MERLQSIKQDIDRRRREIIDLCCNLIRAKGENPPGDVSEPMKIVEGFLREEGIDYERFEPKPGRVNIIAQVGESGKTLILCGHIDVVPAGDSSRWSFPPFCGEVREGEILGRGSTDMKGGVTAILSALSSIYRFRDELPGRLIGAIVCDEEIGGDSGMKWLLEEGKLAGDSCLIAEPSAYLAAGYTIDAGERGVYWLKFAAKGKPAHGSWPIMGENAIMSLASFLPKLKRVEGIEVKVPEDAKKLIDNGKKVLAMIAEQRGMKPEELTWILDHYTVNVGTIKGGTKTNIVPEKCESEVDFRIPIGGSKDEIERFVKDVLPKEIEYEVIQQAVPSYSSPDEKLLKIIEKNVERIFNVTPLTIAIWATADAWRLRERGIPTIIFGPGYGEKAHAYDESVSAEDVVRASKVYACTALEYLYE